MKTQLIRAVFLSAILIGLFSQAFAQEMTRQDYLEKSRKQKTTGFIMAGGGVVLFAIGAGIILGSETETLLTCVSLVNCTSDESELEAGTALSIVGGLAALGSIPVFISSGKNAEKAAQISFRNEPTYIPTYVGNIPRAIPSLSLIIPLN